MQDHGLRDPVPLVLEVMCHSADRLGAALQRPGVVAAAAAWDPGAVPALCILSVAGCPAAPNDWGSEACAMKEAQLQLQPALGCCTRCAHTQGRSSLRKLVSVIRAVDQSFFQTHHGACHCCCQQVDISIRAGVPCSHSCT
jgi:hypothetical protein